jgi:regulator of RNase E activity RraA
MSNSAEFKSRTNPPMPDGWERLFTAVLSDALDASGLRNQAMSPRMRPIDDSVKMCGRARTGIYVEVAHVEPGVNPYELEIAIVDDLKPGDVAVFACGGSSRIAPWGGLLSTASHVRGAAGCVTDGFARDVHDIRELRFPVFSAGIAPLDSKGRGQVQAVDVPVICDGVLVAPGDLVFGDVDGVVVVPRSAEAEVLRNAFSKIDSESHTMEELRAGGYLADIYAKYGVL